MSKLLIIDKFSEFYSELKLESIQQKNLNYISDVNNNNFLYSHKNFSNDLIEQIDDKYCTLYEQEIKYKIFEDTTLINKKDDILELILKIPLNDNIISINKIKLSNKLNKYIKDIHINIKGEKIIANKNIINEKNNSDSKIYIEPNSIHKTISCDNNKNITLCIFLKKNIINKIINKNIFINYSFIILKNKVKFI